MHVADASYTIRIAGHDRRARQASRTQAHFSQAQVAAEAHAVERRGQVLVTRVVARRSRRSGGRRSAAGLGGGGDRRRGLAVGAGHRGRGHAEALRAAVAERQPARSCDCLSAVLVLHHDDVQHSWCCKAVTKQMSITGEVRSCKNEISLADCLTASPGVPLAGERVARARLHRRAARAHRKAHVHAPRAHATRENAVV
jgi:hypothetical protein